MNDNNTEKLIPQKNLTGASTGWKKSDYCRVFSRAKRNKDINVLESLMKIQMGSCRAVQYLNTSVFK